jgi:hypothetical protein
MSEPSQFGEGTGFSCSFRLLVSDLMSPPDLDLGDYTDLLLTLQKMLGFLSEPLF